MAVAARERDDLRRHVLGQAMLEARRFGVQHLADTGDLRGLLGGFGGVVAGNQHVDVATGFCRGGHGVEGRALDVGVVVFGNDESSHDQITLASFLSLATRVATSGTLMPALRLGGSLTLSVFSRGVTSTPRSAGLTTSSGFFFAFMMLGSVT